VLRIRRRFDMGDEGSEPLRTAAVVLEDLIDRTSRCRAVHDSVDMVRRLIGERHNLGLKLSHCTVFPSVSVIALDCAHHPVCH
jgi:hypothetical protein